MFYTVTEMFKTNCSHSVHLLMVYLIEVLLKSLQERNEKIANSYKNNSWIVSIDTCKYQNKELYCMISNPAYYVLQMAFV